MARSRLIKAANYNNQPVWFKTINSLWRNTYSMGTEIKLEKDLLIKAARQSTGLHDFGKHFWDEPMDRLLHSINTESQLHPIGRFITQKRFENLLSVRLRAEHYFKKHPEILDQSLYPVMIIIGLQRTGTTKLHRILASDNDTRALLSWEALNPAPINGEHPLGTKRIKIAQTNEKALKIMSPGFFAIHPVEHLAPEEDVLLLDVSFLSTTAEAIMHVPSYSEWLEKTDQSSAYEYSAKLLKLLQWQRPAKRWVLKTPHHLEFMDLAQKYFGNVQFIWTHRDVHKAIPSFLSMVAHSRILFSDHVDAHEVAEHWVKKIGYMLSRALEYRSQTTTPNQVIDVFYKELVDNSTNVLNQIYREQNLAISPDLQKVFEMTERSNPRSKYGRHQYSLEDFGINRDFIDEASMSYQMFQKKLNIDSTSNF
jgi:hypothetical protein